MLINSSLNTNTWKQISFPSPDATIIQIRGDHGLFTLFNIYLDCDHSNILQALQAFSRLHPRLIRPTDNAHIVWLGDFNRHHPHWDNSTDHRLFTPAHLRAAELLIQHVADWDLIMTLPASMPTHEHHVTKKKSRLDNVFCTPHTTDLIIQCEAMLMDPKPGTDHFPIITILELLLPCLVASPQPDFRKTDWTAFSSELRIRLADFPPAEPLVNVRDLDAACRNLTEALQDVINTTVPLSRPSPHSKRWWTKELTQLHRTMSHLSHHTHCMTDFPNHHSHIDAKTATAIYGTAMEKARHQHWSDWLEATKEPDIWAANKYLNGTPSDAGLTRIPTLCSTDNEGQETLAESNEEKSIALSKAFFPPKPPPIPPDPNFLGYPDEAAPLPRITREQIRRQALFLSPYKAPGPDGIPNIILMKSIETILDHLYYIYTATLNL